MQLISKPSIVKITWKPFELNPFIPKWGLDRKAYLEEKFGGSDEYQSIHQNVQHAAETVGLHFEFDLMQRLPNTRDAHRLIWFANNVGLQNEIVEGLFAAVFLRGQFVGDHSVLGQIGKLAGLDESKVRLFLGSNEGEDEVNTEITQACVRGVQEAPNFLINNRHVIRGAQSPDVMVRIFETALKD